VIEMSGNSSFETCPRCDTLDALQTYNDWKPHDNVSGECWACGYEYFTGRGLATLEAVNERRKEHDLAPLTELAKPVENWKQCGWEPEPNKPKP
jgi:Zn ribbon nucleic-acid-binding protein